MWLEVQIDRTINSSSAGTQRHTPRHMYQLKLICVANGVSHPLRAGSRVDIWMHYWNWRDNGNLHRPVWTGASNGRLHLIKSELYHRWWINGQTWVKMSSLFLNKCFYNQETWGKFATFQNIKVKLSFLGYFFWQISCLTFQSWQTFLGIFYFLIWQWQHVEQESRVKLLQWLWTYMFHCWSWKSIKYIPRLGTGTVLTSQIISQFRNCLAWSDKSLHVHVWFDAQKNLSQSISGSILEKKFYMIVVKTKYFS